MNITEVAQWVIDNRYPKSEFEKLSDHELYHGLIEKMQLVVQKHLLKQCSVSGSLPIADVSRKADKMGREFKKKWEANYVGFGDGSSIELWWRHKIEDVFGGNDR